MEKQLPKLSDQAKGVAGKYRHYGGGEYEVIAVGRMEVDLAEVVVYRALIDGTLWVRPVEDFLAQVEKDGYVGPRFVKVNI